ncbi:MAG: sigma-54-dependent Fis family transcriptional regulator [Planctomycetes bacterium]|nr:sigma-54-dependent Fis family transcriptional regulator [Planctomycetota bacterium]
MTCNVNPHALIVSDDGDTSALLNACLREDFDCRPQIASTYEEAERMLSEREPRALFLDLSNRRPDQSPARLLKMISERTHRNFPVVGIAPQGYAREWADVAHWALDDTLSVPLDRDRIRKLLTADLDRAARVPERVSSQPREAQGQTLRIRTFTPEMFHVIDQLVSIARHDVSLLLIGETGTGKSTLARLVHELSPRSEEVFLTVPCGALPADLIESELFGHVRGAFTGAERDRIGKFAAADRGSILLDEIDVLGASQQAKLLRIIETGEFEPLGSNETMHSGARVIAASNVDLLKLVEENAFRSDLFYRLNVLEFAIPPLRRRKLDIVPLTLGFIEEFTADYQVEIKRIHPEFLAAIRAYSWPGNIRELKNHVRRAVLFCKTGELTIEHVTADVLKGSKGIDPERVGPSTIFDRMADNERGILEQALRENNFKRTATAEALGISRVGLYKKMKKYDLLDLKAPNGSVSKSGRT